MRFAELSRLLLARFQESSPAHYLLRVKKRSRKLRQLFKLIENRSEQSSVGLWTHANGKTFLLGLSTTEGAAKPEVSIVLDRDSVEDLLIDLAAFMMRVDASELRSFANQIQVELESSIENERSSKLH